VAGIIYRFVKIDVKPCLLRCSKF